LRDSLSLSLPIFSLSVPLSPVVSVKRLVKPKRPGREAITASRSAEKSSSTRPKTVHSKIRREDHLSKCRGEVGADAGLRRHPRGHLYDYQCVSMCLIDSCESRMPADLRRTFNDPDFMIMCNCTVHSHCLRGRRTRSRFHTCRTKRYR